MRSKESKKYERKAKKTKQGGKKAINMKGGQRKRNREEEERERRHRNPNKIDT